MKNIFSDNYKWVLGQAKCETALAAASYPASGSYIDVSDYTAVHVFIHLGTLDSAAVFTLQQTDSVSGSLDTIDTVNCKKTIATTDDGQCIYMYLDPQCLAADHHFITCTVSSVAGSNDYGDIFFLLGPARHCPVTQTTTVLPSDNVLEKAG